MRPSCGVSGDGASSDGSGRAAVGRLDLGGHSTVRCLESEAFLPSADTMKR